MNPDDLAALLQLYLDQPGAPPRPSRRDRALAHTLLRRGVPLHHLAHAIRLATLRRHGRNLPPVASLAYYLHVLNYLTPDELDPGYIAYIARRYQRLRHAGALATSKTRFRPPESRGF
jgi:hypothetical protein